MAALAVVGAILLLTLRPDEPSTSVNLEPLAHHGRALQALLDGTADREVLVRYLVVDVLGNLVLFLPLGLAVAGTVGHWAPVARLSAGALFGLGLSIGVELVQLGVPGRASDVDDVIFNTVGAVVGAAAYAVAVRRRGGR
jgi:glycopeptide antibiotics resistance protein